MAPLGALRCHLLGLVANWFDHTLVSRSIRLNLATLARDIGDKLREQTVGWKNSVGFLEAHWLRLLVVRLGVTVQNDSVGLQMAAIHATLIVRELLVEHARIELLAFIKLKLP